MTLRAPHSPYAGTGWLEGWRLTFAGEDLTWEGALATIVEDPDSEVFVAIYDVAEEDLASLDRWEGAELIPARKIRTCVKPVPVVPDAPPTPAQESEFSGVSATQPLVEPCLVWLYVMDAFEGGLPSARYLGHLADCAEAAGAPPEYISALRVRPSRNVGPGAKH